MIRWLRCYIGWMRIWGPWHKSYFPRERAFSRCPDCNKRMCLSAHMHCIPF